MTWFAFQGLNNGKAIDLAGIQEKDAVAFGFHGYGTEQEAEAKPNSVNLLSKWYADTLIADYNAAVKEQAQPGGKNASNPVGAALTYGTSTIFGPLAPAFNAIGGFFNALTQGNTWIRVGEGILGIALIGVSLGKITGTSNVIASTVKKIPL